MSLENLADQFIAEGMAGIETQLDECPDDGDQRLILLDSIRKSIDAVYIENKLLDRMYEIYDACIVEALAIANEDEKFVSYANITSYNLAANLADCWDDAEEKRDTKHFEAGVKAAKRCLELRVQLKKPPEAMAMALFILGVHEYSLKHYVEAEKAWSEKLNYELAGKEPFSEKTDDLNILLSRGLIGLARWSLGTENDRSYKESIDDLEAVRTAENSPEIDLFVSELKLLLQKHGPS